MHPFLAASFATQWTADVARGSGRPTSRGTPANGHAVTDAPELVIRRASAEDAPALRRLGALDGNARAGDLLARKRDVLVAEVDGSLAAALALDGGLAVADPFRPTASHLQLLALRARQLDGAAAHHRRGRLGVLLPRTS